MKFTLMSLEEWKEAYGEGLKAVLENLILKLGLNIERKERERFYFIHAQGFSKGLAVKKVLFSFFFSIIVIGTRMSIVLCLFTLIQ